MRDGGVRLVRNQKYADNVGSIIAGFIAAYGAMYGYDTLYGELWSAVKKLLGGGKSE